MFGSFRLIPPDGERNNNNNNNNNNDNNNNDNNNNGNNEMENGITNGINGQVSMDMAVDNVDVRMNNDRNNGTNDNGMNGMMNTFSSNACSVCGITHRTWNTDCRNALSENFYASFDDSRHQTEEDFVHQQQGTTNDNSTGDAHMEDSHDPNYDYGYTDFDNDIIMDEPTIPEVPNNNTDNTERPTTPPQSRPANNDQEDELDDVEQDDTALMDAFTAMLYGLNDNTDDLQDDLPEQSDQPEFPDPVEVPAEESNFTASEATDNNGFVPEGMFRSRSTTYPFKNMESMQSILFFKSRSEQFSEDDIKECLVYTKNMVEIALKRQAEMITTRLSQMADTLDNDTGTIRSDIAEAIDLVRKTSDPAQSNRTGLHGRRFAHPLANFPTLNSIVHYRESVTNAIPEYKSTEHEIVVDRIGAPATPIKMTMNPISEALKLIISNPEYTENLDCLPDRTEDQFKKLCQGTKWKTHGSFQPPMIVRSNGTEHVQLWVNDTFMLLHPPQDDNRRAYKLSGFFTRNEVTYVEAFPVYRMYNTPGLPHFQYDIGSDLREFEISNIDKDSIVRPVHGDVDSVKCVTRNNDGHLARNIGTHTIIYSELNDKQLAMQVRSSKFKRPLPAVPPPHPPIPVPVESTDTDVDTDAAPVTVSDPAPDFVSGELRRNLPWSLYHPQQNPIETSFQDYMVVRVTPVNLFSDDTSGNRTKKWNPFDYWTMTPSAFAYSMRNQYASHYLVCTSNKLRAGEMTRPIVDDLKVLQDGMEMHCEKFKQPVLVLAPVLFISADNPRHSDIACIQQSGSHFYCRYCYYRKYPPNVNTTDSIQFPEYEATRRCLEHYMAHFFPEDGVDYPPITALNANREEVDYHNYSELGYKNTGCELFLELDSWDPSKDCPVEILHTILLGIAKHCFDLLKNYFFTAAQLAVITTIYSKRRSKAIRTFTSDLSIQGSFVGRDYKYLVQQFPLTLQEARNDPLFRQQRTGEYQEIFDLVIDVFTKIGELSSLLYMAEIKDRFMDYCDLVDKKASELIESVDILEHVECPNGLPRPRANRRQEQADAAADAAAAAAGPTRNNAMGLGDVLNDVNNDIPMDNAFSPILDTAADEPVNGTDRRTDANRVGYRRSGGPLNNRLKFHLMYHLKECLLRFGTALQYETERNEMWNKFFREVIFHTNRHNPSRDIARKFGDEVVLKHIAMGGSWNMGTSIRGNEVVNYFRSAGQSIQAFYFSMTRNFSDNNYMAAYKNYKKGFCGVFELTANDGTISKALGKVVMVNGSDTILDVYQFVEIPFFSVPAGSTIDSCSIFDRGLCDFTSKNTLVQRYSTVSLPKTSVEILDLLDLYASPTATDDQQLYINRYKFGTLWWLKTHNFNLNAIPSQSAQP